MTDTPVTAGRWIPSWFVVWMYCELYDAGFFTQEGER